MKIAYRTASGSVLTWGEDIAKVNDERGAFLEVTHNGGSFQLGYGDFANLEEPDVTLASISAEIPHPFKADSSHTWNGTAFVATDYEFSEPPPPPIPVQSWTELEFRRRFTQDERIAIEAAKTQSAELADFESLLQCAGRSGKLIYNTDPDLIAGLEALKNAGILTPARKAEILGG